MKKSKIEERLGSKQGKLTYISISEQKTDGRTCYNMQCDCGNTRIVRVGSKLKSCGKCDLKSKYPKSYKKKFGKLTVIGWGDFKLDKYGWKHNTVRCKCSCGNIVDVMQPSLTGNLTKSCGCIKLTNEPKFINQKFHKLTIVGWGIKKSYQGTRCVLCKCDCGNLIEKPHQAIYNKKIYSCGKCFTRMEDLMETKLGTKINRLTILNISNFKDKDNATYCNCKCDCGNKCIIKASLLIESNKQHRVGCGECNFMKNGRGTSTQNVKLNKMIGGEHNYYTDVRFGKNNHRINVDVAFPEEKIAVEFDCARWHDNIDSQLKDMEQSLALTKAGWKVLRIKSKRGLPTKAQINYRLEKLRSGKSKFEVIYIGD